MPYKTAYKQNETFSSKGMVVNAVFNSGKVEEITDYSVTYDFTKSGTAKVNVWYLGQNVSFDVKVMEPTMLNVLSNPTKMEYEIGESFDLSGFVAEALYYDGGKLAVDNAKVTASVDTFDSIGSIPVTLKYNNLTYTINVTVKEKDMSEAFTISAENVTGIIGETFKVAINITNNPGFTYLKLGFTYDTDVMTLSDVSNGKLVSSLTEGAYYIWSCDQNAIENGTLAVLTFTLNTEAPLGEYSIEVDCAECSNYLEQQLEVYIVNGSVQIIPLIYGDVNGDGGIDGTDVTRLRKYLADYDELTGISEVQIMTGADANGDGEINGKDLTRLLKYLANLDATTGESDIVLGPQS